MGIGRPQTFVMGRVPSGRERFPAARPTQGQDGSHKALAHFS